MAKQALLLTDVDGKPHVIISATISGVEYDPGKPAVPPEPAVEAVEADPGEPASGANPGRPPTPAVEAKEATKGEPAVPPTCNISHSGGSLTWQGTASHLVDQINS